VLKKVLKVRSRESTLPLNDREGKSRVYTANLEYHGAAVQGVVSGDQLGTGAFNFFIEPKRSSVVRISE
jgi:hypothetical protein